MPGVHPSSRTPPKIDDLYSIKVDNLSYGTTMSDIERYFKKYGELGDIYIPRDRDTHESRGFAFVRYYEERDAEDAMDAMDGKVIDGREIRVAMARYGRPSNQFDPRRHGGGGRGYRDRGHSSYGYRRDRDRDRRRSPPRRRRSYSRSRSRSRSKDKRSRSRSRSPRYHRRSPSPRRSPRKSASPARRRSGSPARRNSGSPSRRRSASPARRSRSRSHHD